VLIVFPWLAWIAVIASATLLAMLWSTGDLSRWSLPVLVAWCLTAAGLQFFGPSAAYAAVGLLLQTLLALYLMLKWKLSAP
jgi:hypothetical protein